MKAKEMPKMSPQQKPKHSYFAGLKTEYDALELEDVYQELEGEFSPATFTGRVLLQQLSLDIVRLGRLQRYEAEALREELNPRRYFDAAEFAADCSRIVMEEGVKAQVSENFLKKVDLIYTRYETNVFNRILRLLEILKALQI
ncbi:MAG: hypothetical protein FJ146_12315 [Deltaproteobacteria bacterium]|nr:hypothetical protein [Deltaproteobacteria bacterium]